MNDCCNVPSTAHAQCYRHQTFVTTALTTMALDLPSDRVEQTFQSRLGRDKWLTLIQRSALPNCPAKA